MAGRWLVELLGLPAGTSVGFVTGATMANFTALAAARHAVLRRIGLGRRAQGLQGAPLVTVITHEGTHVTVYASLQMLGLGREGDRVRRIAADDQGRMRPDALRAELAGIDGPVIVCAQAGNVNTGAFDPFDEIVPIAHERGAWVHVDGAFGIWAAAVPSLRHLMRRPRASADSWSTDAHKWLNVPYDSGLVFVRDAAAHHAAMTLGAAYYVETEGAERDPTTGCPNRRAARAGSRSWPRSGRSGGPGSSTSSSATARSPAGWPTALAAGPRRARSSTTSCSTRSSSGSRRPATTRTGPAATPGRARSSPPSSATARAGWAGRRGRGRAAMRVSVSGWQTTEADIDRSAEAILAASPSTDACA